MRARDICSNITAVCDKKSLSSTMRHLILRNVVEHEYISLFTYDNSVRQGIP